MVLDFISMIIGLFRLFTSTVCEPLRSDNENTLDNNAVSDTVLYKLIFQLSADISTNGNDELVT